MLICMGQFGLPIDALLVFLCCALVAVTAADSNVTVDDGDTTQIIYNPPSSWELTPFDSLDSGGSHMVTTDPTATATFTFTGVSIYFWAPLWPFKVTTGISLDGEQPETIILEDPTQPVVEDGPESAQSAVVWSRTGLQNTEHTLVISVVQGRNLAIVDGLQYTVSDGTPSSLPGSTTTPAPITLSIISTRPLSTPTASASSAIATHQNKTGLSIALGIVCTVAGLIVLYALLWFWRRRQRKRAEEDSLTYDDAPPPEMSDVRSGNTYGYVRPRTHRYVAAQQKPLPAVRDVLSAQRRPAPRRPGPSSLRHSTTAPIPVAAAAAKKPLTTIPEREDALSAASSRQTDTNGNGNGHGYTADATPPWKVVDGSPMASADEDSWTYRRSNNYTTHPS